MLLTVMMLVLAAPEVVVPPPGGLERAGKLTTNPAFWVTMNDYPPQAKRKGREGTVGFLVHYGTDGLPTGCDIVTSSGHADLDATTCQLVQKRARFRPGRNAQGENIGGTYSNRVHWRVP
ncbi:energy transducer TonB [Sphingopyxis sp. MSC1_008]|jgi:protein TonB|uniref:energy transducer TonB n=1 Tax=Sphingopyxis sp. MSC1_008 TaxID=2909265 RepID=UPI0020C0044B|nr:energy transducer TonB [Sphingopyxis sp. MSC1_008]